MGRSSALVGWRAGHVTIEQDWMDIRCCDAWKLCNGHERAVEDSTDKRKQQADKVLTH